MQGIAAYLALIAKRPGALRNRETVRIQAPGAMVRPVESAFRKTDRM